MPHFFWFSIAILSALMMIFLIVAWRDSRSQKARERVLCDGEQWQPKEDQVSMMVSQFNLMTTRENRLEGEISQMRNILVYLERERVSHLEQIDKLRNSIPKGTETQFNLCQAQIEWLYGEMVEGIAGIHPMPKRGEFLHKLHKEGVITLSPPPAIVAPEVMGKGTIDRSKDAPAVFVLTCNWFAPGSPPKCPKHGQNCGPGLTPWPKPEDGPFDPPWRTAAEIDTRARNAFGKFEIIESPRPE